MAHQVFISYSSADAVDAQRVCQALESAGIPCWIAPRDVPPGTDYPATIVDALASSVVVTLLLTEHAVASPHVLTEIGHAFNDRKRIIPFRFASVPLSKDLDYFLSMAQWLDAREGCTDENLHRLVGAVQSALRGEAGAQSVAIPRADRKPMFVALAALVLLAAAGLLYWRWPRPQPRQETVTYASTKVEPVVNTDTASKAAPPVQEAKTWVNPADGATYVRIPAGTFTMGCSPGDDQCSDDEKPAHPVEISKEFWLARTETTIGAYRKYAVQHKLDVPQGGVNLPATGMSWAEARAFCTSVGGRLPAEAEWEYAARGGASGAYYGVLPSIAWYTDNSGDAPHAVGGKKPNAYGLYDMLGNVSEWVLDRYFNKYDLSAPPTGPSIELPLPSNSSAVARGGFWEDEAARVRVSQRAALFFDDAEPFIGFRCASDHS